MNNDRQKILTDYLSYLYTTSRTYDTIGKYIKYVTDFLESAEEINRRGYLAYKRENANIGARYPLMSEAICDLLFHLKIGYNRREKKIKTLERLDTISEKNRKLLNDFIVWLTDSNDYSSHTVDIIRSRFEDREYVRDGLCSYFRIGENAFTDKSEALKKAEEMKIRKIASLRKQMEKLEKLSFKVEEKQQ